MIVLRDASALARVPGDLAALLASVARGNPPTVDFATDLRPHPPGPTSAVLGFTGHHVVAADVSAEWMAANADPNDFAYPMRATFLAALGAKIDARPGPVDLVLVTVGGNVGQSAGRPGVAGSLEQLSDETHARLLRARRYRDEVVAYGTEGGAGMLTLGRGLAGRLEVSFEVAPTARGAGLGRWLAAVARELVEPGELIFAQVSPGNVASVRALLAAGYEPIGSEVLFLDAARRTAPPPA